MIKIRITEDPNTVKVVRDGQTHLAQWDDEETLRNVKGDENLLKAALTAWDGQTEFELTPEQLERSGGGWWSAN